jgi:hypothetical protein
MDFAFFLSEKDNHLTRFNIYFQNPSFIKKLSISDLYSGTVNLSPGIICISGAIYPNAKGVLPIGIYIFPGVSLKDC